MNIPSFHEEVRVVPYQEEWVYRFYAMRERIIALLLAVGIECDVRHVGGTAVPGVFSKPIVDVLVMVSQDVLEMAAKTLADTLLCLGECGRPGRYFFSDGDTEHDAVYIHLISAENKVAKDQLTFLNMLQSSQKLQKEYAERKIQLAEQYPHDRSMYRLLKGVFIQNCLNCSERDYDIQCN